MKPRCKAMSGGVPQANKRCRRRRGHLGQHRNVRNGWGVTWWSKDQPDCPPPISAHDLQEALAMLENIPDDDWPGHQRRIAP